MCLIIGSLPIFLLHGINVYHVEIHYKIALMKEDSNQSSSCTYQQHEQNKKVCCKKGPQTSNHGFVVCQHIAIALKNVVECMTRTLVEPVRYMLSHANQPHTVV